jgi:hypothetical protein
VVSRGKNLRRVKRSAMDIRSSSSLRRKNSENKIFLDSELQETENAITTLQSNIHYNTVTTIHVNPSIMNIQYQTHIKMEEER